MIFFDIELQIIVSGRAGGEFIFNRATIIVRHGIWSGLSNSVLNMLLFARKTCSDMQYYGLDFISHAERKNAEEWW